MVMVDVDSSSHLSADTAQVGWLDLGVCSHLLLNLYLSHELLIVNSCNCYYLDETTMNVIVGIIISHVAIIQ